MKRKLKIRHSASVPSERPSALRCGVYCRKSTADDREKNPENKSTTHQIAKAKAYATSKGWKVDDEHVYVDDGISGAEYVNRPGFGRLLASLPKRGKPPFDVLIMSESSRLGRDLTRNAAFIVSIIECGVRIFYYLSDEEEKADTPEQQLMITLRSYASATERLKAGQRTRTVLESKAKQGYCAGGSCHGYRTVEKLAKNSAGEEVRSHVDYVINEQEASVVRHLYRMYLAGFGHSSIAKTMNGDPAYRAENRKFFGGRRPPGPRTGTGSWAPSSIRAMLYNERYTGKVPYGRLRRVYRGGTQTRVVAGKPTFADRPDLRIISEELWNAVHKRLKAVKNYYVREQGGTLWGRPEIGRESKYLLSGLARCGLCGSALVATKGLGNGRGMLARYACSYNSNRGRTVCINNWRAPQDKLDAKVLGEIERSLLTPARIEQIMDQALKDAKNERRREPDKTKELESRIKRLEREKDNLLNVARAGKIAPESVLAGIRSQEAEIEAAKEELARSPHRLDYDEREFERLKNALSERVSKFKELMHADVPLARQALRKLLNGPIKCIPVERDGRKTYEIRGETKLGALFIPASVRLVPRKGFEPPQCCHR